MPQNSTWQTQHAKAQFSKLVRKAIEEGDQFIQNRGKEVVVLISKSKYDALTMTKGSLIDFFLQSPCKDVDIEINRSKDILRDFEI